MVKEMDTSETRITCAHIFLPHVVLWHYENDSLELLLQKVLLIGSTRRLTAASTYIDLKIYPFLVTLSLLHCSHYIMQFLTSSR